MGRHQEYLIEVRSEFGVTYETYLNRGFSLSRAKSLAKHYDVQVWAAPLHWDEGGNTFGRDAETFKAHGTHIFPTSSPLTEGELAYLRRVLELGGNQNWVATEAVWANVPVGSRMGWVGIHSALRRKGLITSTRTLRDGAQVKLTTEGLLKVEGLQ